MNEKRRILVVEDEQDISTYLAALLEDNGYEVITADNGIAGLEIARSQEPDLITLDMALPDQSGVRTYRKYREDPQLQKIPVIIVTGVGDSMRSYLKKLKGFPEPEGFMNKPIDEEKLLAMVQGLLT